MLGVKCVDKQIRRDERCLSIVILIFNIILSSGLASAQCGDCDDNDPCTMDLCESMTCQHIPLECSHDNFAAGGWLGNFANSSAPKSPEIPVQSPQGPSSSNQASSIPESCDDGNPCTRDSYGANGCVHDPVNCDDGNASTLDSCGSSGCINMPLPGIKTQLAQSSGSIEPEIKNEASDENMIINGSQSITDEPQSLLICDDGNPCTTDSHDGTNCVYVPLNCDDGKDSTEDSCVDGTCINKPLISADFTTDISENNSTNLSASQSPLAAHHPPNCDDGDPCTEDTFNGKECEHKPKVCDDGDPNTYDYCYEGVCHSTTTNCDDGDPCTIDSFNGTACVHTPMNCDDHNACTIDSCEDGKCVHKSKKCDDSNPCTSDKCNPKTGSCISTWKCDDGNPCTEDYCDSIRGCLHRPVVCGSGRTCIDGLCQRLYYPYAVPYYPYYPTYAAPAASAAPAAQTYTIPAGTAITLPWEGKVTALNALNVENAVAYPGASPLKYVRQLGLESQATSVGQAAQSISERSEMIGLSWKDASFSMTLIQPNGVALPLQGDNRNVIHLIGPNYDYYFLRNAAPGSWAIVIQPINPGASGTGFSLINGLVKGASVINRA
ncbi:MAG: hypothetical protein A4E49_01901 [Methanosaeta sp. PtaU1.Bin112]|nr:MAG: hypothetical protein A4E49_01901 [Methanosaeta sp. PtaU1.Bin112]